MNRVEMNVAKNALSKSEFSLRCLIRLKSRTVLRNFEILTTLSGDSSLETEFVINSQQEIDQRKGFIPNCTCTR